MSQDITALEALLRVVLDMNKVKVLSTSTMEATEAHGEIRFLECLYNQQRIMLALSDVMEDTNGG